MLVVRAGALGDTLMITPVLRALGARYPEASIDVLCSEAAAPLLELHPGVRRLFSLKWRNLPHVVSAEKRRLIGELRKRDYDLALLLERAPRYKELLDRAKLREVRGFHETPFDPERHAIVNNLRAAGMIEDETELDMELFFSEEDRARAGELVAAQPRPLIGLHIGYGPRAKKRDQSARLKGWPLDNSLELGRKLVETGAGLVLTGSREDRADVGKLSSGLPALDVAGRTSVRELGALIQKLDVFVSVDSGPAHMAAAVGTPLVVLWGPAILQQVKPISSKSPITILRHPVPCAPCYDTPLMKTCRRNICMEGIEPAEVLAATRELLR